MCSAVAGGGIGDAAHQVVDVAQAAGQIMDVVRDETAKANEAARTADNEFNIRKNFLDNTVNAIKEATLGQYNIVICTDQAGDEFQELTGQVLPLDLVDVDVGDGKSVNFQVNVFDTGKYLRRGKWERDSWWWYGESTKFSDIDMHVHFDNAQPKLNPEEIEQKQEAQAGEAETADTVKAATGGESENGNEEIEDGEDIPNEAQEEAADGTDGGAEEQQPEETEQHEENEDVPEKQAEEPENKPEDEAAEQDDEAAEAREEKDE